MNISEATGKLDELAGKLKLLRSFFAKHESVSPYWCIHAISVGENYPPSVCGYDEEKMRELMPADWQTNKDGNVSAMVDGVRVWIYRDEEANPEAAQ